MYDVLVIGAGASGMTAAIFAAENGAKTAVLEKEDRVGKKLSITGKGRCNVTNNSDISGLMRNIPRNPKFLYGAFSAFSAADTMNFFEKLGVPLKTERGKRVFPVSDRASDVVKALENEMKRLNVELIKGRCGSLVIENGKCSGVRCGGREIRASAVILACGGMSYPKTGSDGSGYNLARRAGHTIIAPVPSLCGLVTEEKWVRNAAGLNLRNVMVSLYDGSKVIYKELGELAFTPDGAAGPTVLSASAHIADIVPERYRISIDLKPALSESKLDTRILRDFSENKGKRLSESLNALLPQKLIGVITELSGIEPSKRVDDITKSERANLVRLLKNLSLKIASFRPIEEAVITRGGVCVKEIDPRTMESKLVKNLYFCGEIIDCDAYTGGFNLQIAFSTGCQAGKNAAVR